MTGEGGLGRIKDGAGGRRSSRRRQLNVDEELSSIVGRSRGTRDLRGGGRIISWSASRWVLIKGRSHQPDRSIANQQPAKDVGWVTNLLVAVQPQNYIHRLCAASYLPLPMAHVISHSVCDDAALVNVTPQLNRLLVDPLDVHPIKPPSSQSQARCRSCRCVGQAGKSKEQECCYAHAACNRNSLNACSRGLSNPKACDPTASPDVKALDLRPPAVDQRTPFV